MKKLSLLLCLLCTISTVIYSETVTNFITYGIQDLNDGQSIDDYLYPGFPYVYSLNEVLTSGNLFVWSSATYTVSLTNGQFCDQNGTLLGTSKKDLTVGHFYVKWNDIVNTNGAIQVTLKDKIGGIVYSAGTTSFTKQIASIKGLTPNAEVGPSITPLGSTNSMTAQVFSDMMYPYIAQKKVRYYQWTLPKTWRSPQNNTSNNTFITGYDVKSITVIPDNVSTGSIVIRGVNDTETGFSDAQTINLDRGFSWTAKPSSITYLDSTPKVFSVTNFNGFTYEWNAPSGWSINGQGNDIQGQNLNSVTITPSFCSKESQVKVRLSYGSETSDWYICPYDGISSYPTINVNTNPIYQYEDANITLANISSSSISSLVWSGTNVQPTSQSGVNTTIAFTKPGTTTLNANITTVGCSTPIVITKQVNINNSRIAITGSKAVCGNSTYSLNFPTSLPVTWSKSDNLLYVNGQSTNLYTIDINGNGVGWIKAIIGNSELNYGMWVGYALSPTISGNRPYVWTDVNVVPYGTVSTKEYHLQYGQDINIGDENIGTYGNLSSNFQWEWENGNGNGGANIYNYGDGQILFEPYEYGSYRIRTRITDACGLTTDWSIPIFVVVDNENAYSMSLSPNPASSEVQVKIATPAINSQNKLAASTNETNSPAIITEISDSYGRIVYKSTKKGNTFTIPVNHLPNGVYNVTTSNGLKVYQKKLFVKH